MKYAYLLILAPSFNLSNSNFTLLSFQSKNRGTDTLRATGARRNTREKKWVRNVVNCFYLQTVATESKSLASAARCIP